MKKRLCTITFRNTPGTPEHREEIRTVVRKLMETGFRFGSGDLKTITQVFKTVGYWDYPEIYISIVDSHIGIWVADGLENTPDTLVYSPFGPDAEFHMYFSYERGDIDGMSIHRARVSLDVEKTHFYIYGEGKGILFNRDQLISLKSLISKALF